VVGFYALRVSGEQAELDHLWIDPSHMGRGFGRLLLRHAAKRALERGVRELTIDSDPNAAGFYESMGAERVGSIAAAMDGVPRERPQFRMMLGGDGNTEPPAGTHDRSH
jgi:GNAT superfamily N-acetyltransferase